MCGGGNRDYTCPTKPSSDGERDIRKLESSDSGDKGEGGDHTLKISLDKGGSSTPGVSGLEYLGERSAVKLC